MPEVALDDMLIEIGQLAAMACNPTQKSANHVEAAPSAVPNEPLFDKTSGAAARQTVRVARF